MRRSLFALHLSLLAAVTLLTHSGCGTTVYRVSHKPRPLAYVGRVAFGEAVKREGKVVVPLDYTGGEWAENSAIVPVRVDATLKDAEIDMTVTTAVASGSAKHGYELILPGDVAGEYVVYYRDPDGARRAIGSIEITE